MAVPRTQNLLSRFRRTGDHRVDAELLRSFYLHSDELVERHFAAVLQQDLGPTFSGVDILEDDWNW